MSTKKKSLFFAFALVAGGTVALAEWLHINAFAAWFTAVNLTNFLIMGKDKLIAASKSSAFSRTPEQTFFILALLGGFPGLFAGRKLFNHKTTKKSFVLTMWLLFAFQVGASAWYAHYNGWNLNAPQPEETSTEPTE